MGGEVIVGRIDTYGTIALLGTLIVLVTAFALRLTYEVHPALFVAATAFLTVNLYHFYRTHLKGM